MAHELPTDRARRVCVHHVQRDCRPGSTGTPEIGGFTSAQCQQLIRGLVGVNFVAYDLVEVMPPYDSPGGVTCLLAANLVYEFMSLIALLRRG